MHRWPTKSLQLGYFFPWIKARNILSKLVRTVVYCTQTRGVLSLKTPREARVFWIHASTDILVIWQVGKEFPTSWTGCVDIRFLLFLCNHWVSLCKYEDDMFCICVQVDAVAQAINTNKAYETVCEGFINERVKSFGKLTELFSPSNWSVTKKKEGKVKMHYYKLWGFWVGKTSMPKLPGYFCIRSICCQVTLTQYRRPIKIASFFAQRTEDGYLLT